jgi:hypothetical protein
LWYNDNVKITKGVSPVNLGEYSHFYKNKYTSKEVCFMKKLSFILALLLMLTVLAGCSPAVQDESAASSQSGVTDTSVESETEAESESIDIFADVEPAEVPEVPEELFFQPLDYDRHLATYVSDYFNVPHTLKELYDHKFVGNIVLCDVVSDIDEYAEYESNLTNYTDVRVVRVIKGEFEEGDMITVRDEGRRNADGSDTIPDDGGPLLRKNMRVLLFLMPIKAGSRPDFAKEGYKFTGLGATPYLGKVYIDENNMAYPTASYIDAVRDYPVWECLDDFKKPVPLGKLIAVLESYAE